MTQAQALAMIDRWLINITFAVAVLFPAVTAFFWPWWRSVWGINMILLEGCIAVTLLPTLLLLDFGIDNWALQWLQAAALTGVAAVIIWRGFLIWRTQAAGREER